MTREMTTLDCSRAPAWTIAGLNCNGNPLHPDPVHRFEACRGCTPRMPARESSGPAPRRDDVRPARRGAGWSTRPNWIVNAWNSAALDALDYQWTIAEEFWREIDRAGGRPRRQGGARAAPAESGVQHRRVSASSWSCTGATNIGVELDASHLFWQRMDPVAVVQDLGPLVVHAAAKDVRINPARRRLRRTRQPIPSNGARRAANEPRRGRMGQRVAEGRSMGLRGPW